MNAFTARLRGWCLLAVLLVAPQISAAQTTCQNTLGRGWPPASQIYGSALEQLFAGDVAPALMLIRMPEAGPESALLIMLPTDGADWTLRYAVAKKRVHNWNGNQLEFRTNQKPEIVDVPIPDVLASELVDTWFRALELAVPADAPPQFSEQETWSFAAGSMRVSGAPPSCGSLGQVPQQVRLLIEATDESEKKRARRWTQLALWVEELSNSLGVAATVSEGFDALNVDDASMSEESESNKPEPTPPVPRQKPKR